MGRFDLYIFHISLFCWWSKDKVLFFHPPHWGWFPFNWVDCTSHWVANKMQREPGGAFCCHLKTGAKTWWNLIALQIQFEIFFRFSGFNNGSRGREQPVAKDGCWQFEIRDKSEIFDWPFGFGFSDRLFLNLRRVSFPRSWCTRQYVLMHLATSSPIYPTCLHSSVGKCVSLEQRSDPRELLLKMCVIGFNIECDQSLSVFGIQSPKFSRSITFLSEACKESGGGWALYIQDQDFKVHSKAAKAVQ